MRLTLAFLAGLLAGFLLAWTSGPALTRLASQWQADAPMETWLRIRSAFTLPPGGLAAADSEPSFSFRLLRPVTLTLRMAVSRPALPPLSAASNAATLAASGDKTETLLSSVNASAAADALSAAAFNGTGVSLTEASGAAAPERKVTDAEPGAELVAARPAQGESRPATEAKPDSGEKDRRSPQEVYDLALGNYQSGRHELAREGFAAFLKRWPRHALAPNALYWSGETWYARGRYDRAAKFFAQVVRDYPRHAKSPDALLKQAYSAMRQGRLEQAGSYLRDLEARYPDSPASRLGRQARIRLQGQNGTARVVLVHG
jgi:tol-pal system protein YbgF